MYRSTVNRDWSVRTHHEIAHPIGNSPDPKIGAACRPPRSFQKRRYATSRNPLNGAAILAVPRLNPLCSFAFSLSRSFIAGEEEVHHTSSTPEKSYLRSLYFLRGFEVGPYYPIQMPVRILFWMAPAQDCDS